MFAARRYISDAIAAADCQFDEPVGLDAQLGGIGEWRNLVGNVIGIPHEMGREHTVNGGAHIDGIMLEGINRLKYIAGDLLTDRLCRHFQPSARGSLDRYRHHPGHHKRRPKIRQQAHQRPGGNEVTVEGHMVRIGVNDLLNMQNHPEVFADILNGDREEKKDGSANDWP